MTPALFVRGRRAAIQCVLYLALILPEGRTRNRGAEGPREYSNVGFVDLPDALSPLGQGFGSAQSLGPRSFTGR
ncbi:hypothetical protein CALCODRAFT_489175 [Calocera cornea HHB12733]|uniref:Uncharacterized protein n=1 Tax=Calocera cornea HHB12733 TaxID=1353952 RepID=A0A166JFT7_9BASI|nr:hypothetical protein CALCODRAFT_489175 [Calocera cornea HHB12733]